MAKKGVTTMAASPVKRCGRLHALALSRQAAIGLPRPLCLDGFLSNGECSSILRELEFTLWRPSLTYQKQEDGEYRDVLNVPFRVSETAYQEWFSDELNAQLAQIEKRLQTLIDFDSSYLEPWQATSYALNGHFNYHLDAGYWENHFAGDRILTFLIYLTTPKKGGSTHFRALDIDIRAKAGRLVVWNNLFPDGGCDHRMTHSGAPLLEGEKTTLVTWMRQKPCRTL